MATRKQPSGEHRDTDPEVTIERAFEFARDMLDDPAVLDELSARAELTITPIEDQRADTHYDATTRRFAISAMEMTRLTWRRSPEGTGADGIRALG